MHRGARSEPATRQLLGRLQARNATDPATGEDMQAPLASLVVIIGANDLLAVSPTRPACTAQGVCTRALHQATAHGKQEGSAARANAAQRTRFALPPRGPRPQGLSQSVLTGEPIAAELQALPSLVVKCTVAGLRRLRDAVAAPPPPLRNPRSLVPPPGPVQSILVSSLPPLEVC